MDDYIEATQALDFGDETDEEDDGDKSAGFLKVRCQKGFPEKLFPLYEGDNVIGRHESCSISIPLKPLSREHACIEIHGDSHLIYDKGSRNRTQRNKHFLQANVRYELKDKDVLVFGDVECEYQLQDKKHDDDETGSETGSESCFQTAPIDETLDATGTGNQSSKSKLPLDTDEEEYASDASSDILEPTQPFAANTQLVKMSSTASTDSWNRTHNMTVKETPAATKTKRFTDNLVLPESDPDTDDEADGRPPITMTTLAIDSQDVDESADKTALMGLATQAYICESDVDTGDENDTPKKKALLTAATQAYTCTDDDVSSHSEDTPMKRALLGAATQAFMGADSGTDTEGEQVETRARRQVQLEPTCAYDMGRGIEPTMAYDMDGEDDDDDRHKADDSKSKSMMYEPTQAYNADDVDDDDDDDKAKESKSKSLLYEPTQAYNADDTDEETEPAASKSKNLMYEATQAYNTGGADKTGDDVKYDSDTSEEFVLEDEDKESLEDVSHLFMAPTLVCDLDDPGGGESDSNGGEKGTMEFDATDATQEFDNDSTQVLDDQPKSGIHNLGTKKRKANDANIDATQVFDNDATQVFDDQPKSGKNVMINKSRKSADIDATQVFENDATQVFDENIDARKGPGRKSAESAAATQVFPDETQVFEENIPSRNTTQQGEIATQVFDDATQVIDDATPEDTANHKHRKIKVTDQDLEDATQNFDVAELGKEISFDINAVSTLAMEPVTICETNGNAMDSKSHPSNDATQVFDETVAISEDGTVAMNDDATMDVTVAAATVAVTEPDIAESKTRKRRVQNKATPFVNDSTQVFDETVNVTEIDATVPLADPDIVEDKNKRKRGKQKIAPIGDDATQVFDETVKVTETEATVAVTDPDFVDGKSKRKRGRQKAAAIADDATQVFDETVKATEIDSTVAIANETLAVTEQEEAVIKKGRKTKAAKQTRTKASPYEARVTPVADATLVLNEVDATMAITEPESSDHKPKPATRPRRKGTKKGSPYVTNDETPSLENESLPATRMDSTLTIATDETLAITEVTDAVAEVETRPKRGRKGKAVPIPDVKNNTKTDVKSKASALDLDDCGDSVKAPVLTNRSYIDEPATQVYGRSPIKSGQFNVELDLEPATQVYGRSPIKSGQFNVEHDLEPATQIYGKSPEKRANLSGDDLEPATQMYGMSPAKLTPRKKGFGEPDLEPETQLYGMSPVKGKNVVTKLGKFESNVETEQTKDELNSESTQKGKAVKKTKLSEGKTKGKELKKGDNAEQVETESEVPKGSAAASLPATGRRSGRSKARGRVAVETVEEPVEVNKETTTRRGRQSHRAVEAEEKQAEEPPKRGRRSKQTTKTEPSVVEPPIPAPGTSGIETEQIISSQDDDATPPLSEETIPDSQDTLTSPIIPKPQLVPIPSRSPLKSALASPERKASPSPKRVQFISQGSEESSLEAEAPTGRGRRGKKPVVPKEVTTKQKGGQKKGKVVVKKAEVTNEKAVEKSVNILEVKKEQTNSVLLESETPKVAAPRQGRSTRGKVAETTSTISDKTAGKRGRRSLPSKHEEPVKTNRSSLPAVVEEQQLQSKSELISDKSKSEMTINKNTTEVVKPTRKVRGRKTSVKNNENDKIQEETDHVLPVAPSPSETDNMSGKGKRTKGKRTKEVIVEESEPQNIRAFKRTKAEADTIPSSSKSVTDDDDIKTEVKETGRHSRHNKIEGKKDETPKTKSSIVDEVKHVNKRTSLHKGGGESGKKTGATAAVKDSTEIVDKRTTRGKGDTVDKDSQVSAVQYSSKRSTRGKDVSETSTTLEGSNKSVTNIVDENNSNKRSIRGREVSKADTSVEDSDGKGIKIEDKHSNKSVSRKHSEVTNIKVEDKTHAAETSNSEVSKRKSRHKDKTEEESVQLPVKGNTSVKQTEHQQTSGGRRTTRQKVEEKQKEEKLEPPTTQGVRKGRATRTSDSQESQPDVTPAKKQKTSTTPAATPQSTGRKAPAPSVATPRSAAGKLSTPAGTPRGTGKQALDAPLPSSPSLRKTTTDGHKPHVMFTGVTDEQGEKIVKELGGELVSSVHECTHLVTDQIRRTVKFLCCLSRGVPIVTPQWLVSSKRTSMFADPGPFLLKDYASEKKHKFTLHRSLDKAIQNLLLTGYKIHVTKSVKPDPNQMKDILRSAGAQYLATMPKTAGDETLVISCEDDEGLCEGAVRAGVRVVSAEFVLTGVLRQEVDIASYQLFASESSGNGRKRHAAGSEPEPAAKRRKR